MLDAATRLQARSGAVLLVLVYPHWHRRVLATPTRYDRDLLWSGYAWQIDLCAGYSLSGSSTASAASVVTLSSAFPPSVACATIRHSQQLVGSGLSRQGSRAR